MEYFIARITIGLQGAVVGVHDAALMVCEEDDVIGMFHQLGIALGDGEALALGLVLPEVKEAGFVTPEEGQAQTGGEDQEEGDEGDNAGKAANGKSDFTFINLGDEKPRGIRHGSYGGKDGDAAVVYAFKHALPAARDHEGRDLRRTDGKMEGEGCPFAMTEFG